MTDSATHSAEDIAYVRQLSESGARAPLIGGRFMAWWGLLLTIAYLLHHFALRGDMGVKGRRLLWLLAVAMLAALYSAWTLWGAGRDAFLWGMGLFALGLPLYFLMKWWRRRAANVDVATSQISG